MISISNSLIRVNNINKLIIIQHHSLYKCFSLKGNSNSNSNDKVISQRLERIISNRGIGSRNDVAKLLKQGRISINGKIVYSGSDKYPNDIIVEVDGIESKPIPLLAIYHKPVGIHSVMRDPWGRGNLAELVREYPYLKSLHPVGRLDADTSGLLLFSSDGHLTQTLLHPSTGIEREYEAVVIGTVNFEELKRTLANGVKTTEGTFSGELKHSENLDRMVPLPTFNDDNDNDDDDDDDDTDDTDNKTVTKKEVDSNSKLVSTSKVRLTVSEGKYRMVRRILHNAGHSVIELHRVRYGHVNLSNLEEGDVRECSIEERDWAKKLLK